MKFDKGGTGRSLLVLIHGLGATAGVWHPMLQTAKARWPGRWIAVDLRGHGGSVLCDRYEPEDYVVDLAALIAIRRLRGPVTIVGHSMGGVLALMLASSRRNLRPEAVFALGVKVNWTDAEVARIHELAARPPKMHESRADAIVQHRRVAGLPPGPEDEPMVARGAVAEGQRWRAAMDMRAFRITPPPMRALLDDAICPVYLARGEDDSMVSHPQLAALDPEAVTISGAGHNAMVNQPDRVWDWIIQGTASAGSTA